MDLTGWFLFAFHYDSSRPIAGRGKAVDWTTKPALRRRPNRQCPQSHHPNLRRRTIIRKGHLPRKVSTEFPTVGSNMAKRKAKRQQVLSSTNARETIAEDVQAFLAAGKKIQKIPAGVSGWRAQGGTRHIVISKSKKN